MAGKTNMNEPESTQLFACHSENTLLLQPKALPKYFNTLLTIKKTAAGDSEIFVYKG